MPTTHIQTVPFFYLMQWEFIRYLPLLKDDSRAEADVEYMLKVIKNQVEEQLTFCMDDNAKIKQIEEMIQSGLKWLEYRIGGIYLLDGKLENLNEKTDFIELATPLNISKELAFLKNFLNNQPPAELTITIDEEIPLIDIRVKALGKFNWKDVLSAWKFYKNMTGSLKKDKIEIPDELISMIKSTFLALLFKGNKTKELTKMVYHPLIMIQLKREQVNFLVDKRTQLIEESQKKTAISNLQLPTWLENVPTSDTDKREIKIKPVYLPYIAEKLKPYFSDEDFILLAMMIEGKSIKPKRITFKESGAMLGYFLKEMHGKEVVIESKKKLTEQWLGDYFDFANQKSKTNTPFTLSMAHLYLTKDITLKGKNTINISDFEEFDKKNS